MSWKKALTVSSDGVLIKLHVLPGSQQSIFPGGFDNWRHRIIVKVRSPAQENKANNEVKQLIAEYFDIQPRDVMLVSGEKNKEKTILLKQLPIAQVQLKLEVAFLGL